MKSKLIPIIIGTLFAASIFSLSMNTNKATAVVTCVDKYQYTSIIPCYDQNAIVKTNSSGTTQSSTPTMATNLTAPSSGGNVAIAECKAVYNQDPKNTSSTCLNLLGENLAAAAKAGLVNVTPGANLTGVYPHGLPYMKGEPQTQPASSTPSPPNPATTNQPAIQNDRFYEGLNWWAVCNNPLLKSYISQSCDVLVTPDKNALTSKGKVVLEGILCPRGPSIVTTLELFYGTIPQKLKNDLAVACGWH